MEDVDEGFGSNESNNSPVQSDSTDFINGIKSLNGQCVLGKTLNGKFTLNGKNCSLTNTHVDSISLCQKDEGDTTNEKSPENKSKEHNKGDSKNPCTDFEEVFRVQHETSDDLETDKILAKEQRGNECQGNKIGGTEKLTEDDLNQSSDLKDYVTETNFHTCDAKGDAKKNEENGNSIKPDLDDDKNFIDDLKLEFNDEEQQEESKTNTDLESSVNITPVKQKTLSADGAKSPFVLDDKVRNSLKGLVDKVKSSELTRDSLSPVESIHTVSDSQTSPRLQSLECVDDTNSLLNNEKDDSQSSVSENNDPNNDDSILLGNDDDGIAMEIGSDSEELLLNLDPDETKSSSSSETENNFKETSTSSFSKNIKENKETSPDSEDTNNSCPVEIISDNEEEEATGKSVEKFSASKQTEDSIQFEDDSNSNFTNGSVGKITDIVNFLNQDLSGSNSPLSLNSNSNLDNSSTVKVNEDNEKDVSMETDITEIKVTNKDEIEPKNVGSKCTDVEKNILTKNRIKLIDVDNEDISCKKTELHKPKVVSSPKENNDREHIDSLDEVSEKIVENNSLENNTDCDGDVSDNDEDDDVIFEGETIVEKPKEEPSKKNKEPLSPKTVPANENLNETLSSESTEKSSPSHNVNDTKNISDKANDTCEEEDDDVIFEKETKIDDKESKQNCDKLLTKTSSNRKISESADKVSNANAVKNTGTQSVEHDTTETTIPNTNREPSDRKRSAEEKEFSEIERKRSRLDLPSLIGKLGSRVEPASIELSDSEEDEMSETTDTAEERSNTVDEEEVKEKEKYITLTEKELEDLVREKVKAYMTSHRDTLVAKLSQKVKDLQLNNDLWKRQVKDLQVKVNDVTVLQQKLERRKAATAALRQITTRNVSVQVEEGRTMSAHTVIKEMLAMKMQAVESTIPQETALSSPLTAHTRKVGSTSPRVNHCPVLVAQTPSNNTIRLPIPSSVTPPVNTANLPQGTKLVTSTYQTPSVKSLLDTTRLQKTIGSVQQTTTTTTVSSVLSLLQYPSNVLSKTTTPQGFPQQAVMTQVSSTNGSKTPTRTVTLTSPGAKIIDLTDDDESTKARLVTIPPGMNANTPQAIRHVLAPGTQLLRSGTSQPTYQLVFSSPPSSGMMVSVQSAVPKTTTLLQTVQQNVSNLTTQPETTTTGGVTPGTSLARVTIPTTAVAVSKFVISSHPAPFPDLPANQAVAGLKQLPPKPSLRISRSSQGIVLSWNMSLSDSVAEISNYQLFAYQETSAQPTPSLWKKVGDVKALPLPMACTLSQFQVGNKYHFAVRAMDIHNRVGNFSDPSSIHLTPTTPAK